MKPHEIISHVAAQIGMHPGDANKLVDQKIGEGMKHAQHGDTIMFYKLIDHDSCFVHFVTADAPLNLVSNIAYFVHMLQSNGINTIYMNTRSKRINIALSSAGVHLEPSDNPSYPMMGKLM